jgi:uncharacterized protein (DUF1778 family)
MLYSVRGRGKVMARPHKEQRVELRLGKSVFRKVPVRQALDVLQGHVEAELAAIERQRRINRDNAWVAFIARLHRKPPPQHKEYVEQVFKHIDEARTELQRWSGAHLTAAVCLRTAARNYSALHRRWVEHHEDVIKGAEAGKTFAEVIILAAAVYGSVGVGYVAGTTMGAAASGVLTLVDRSWRQVGFMAYGVERQFDWPDIVIKSATSFALSLLTGKVGDKFLGKLADRLVVRYGTYLGERLSAKTLKMLLENVLANIASEEVSDFFLEAIEEAGRKAKEKKNVNMNTFMEMVIDELPQEELIAAIA